MQLPRAWPSLLLLVAAAIACRPACAASKGTVYHQSGNSGVIKFKSASGCAFELVIHNCCSQTTKFADPLSRGQRQVA